MQRNILPFILGIAILAIIGGSLYFGNLKEEIPPPEDPRPTDFGEIGVIAFDTPGLKSGVPYLIYEEPGAPAITKELAFDTLSTCVTESGALPCLAMSVTLDVPFGGKRTVVEGIAEGEGVLVRKLWLAREGEFEPVLYGRVFIPWPEAVSLIENCRVSMVFQTHQLDVTLTLKNETQVTAVEPVIDAVFSVVQNAGRSCGSIPVATE